MSGPPEPAAGAAAPVIEVTRGEYTISTDPAKLDLDVVHGYLTQSYWAQGIPRDVVRRSIAHSIPFGLYHAGRQVGFARWITDHATFAYLGDVFVLEAHRGRGLSKWLMEVAVAHPAVQGQRRWVLLTRDAHGLYRQFGFAALRAPDRYMERHWRDVYATAADPPAPDPGDGHRG
jgi:GNAT superfamily N-acetyltransferase